MPVCLQHPRADAEQTVCSAFKGRAHGHPGDPLCDAEIIIAGGHGKYELGTLRMPKCAPALRMGSCPDLREQPA